MFRREMTRVYELRDLIADPSHSLAYFQSFDDSIRESPSAKRVWLAREREFQRLDPESWEFLKNEACPYLTTRDTRRGWEQLIAILSQARAHNYLIDEGCAEVRFIPRSKIDGQQTPDIEGILKGRKVICEVKTVNMSEAEAIRRETGAVGRITNSLNAGLFNKLKDDLFKAESQMKSYGGEDTRRIAFVILNFDDFLGEYKAEYYEQIDRYLATQPIPSLDIVFYNQMTAFHRQVVMQNAVVINEGG